MLPHRLWPDKMDRESTKKKKKDRKEEKEKDPEEELPLPPDPPVFPWEIDIADNDRDPDRSGLKPKRVRKRTIAS